MRTIDLSNSFKKLAEDSLESPSTNGDDNSFGVVIPKATVLYLRDRVIKTYNLMLNGVFGEIVKLYSSSLPDLIQAEDLMISLVNSSDKLDLKTMAKNLMAVLSKLSKIRKSLYDNIPHFAMAKKIDELLKRVQDNLWKDSKRIYSCPELKGKEIYTWNEGPGANPVEPVRTFPKSMEKIQRQKLMNPDPNQVFIDVYNKHQEKVKKVPTFDEYEALLDSLEE